jgi:hypothetical protein
MSDQTQQTIQQPPYVRVLPDTFLQGLVDTVNIRGFEIGITLHVGGFLVSGKMVGVDKYFEGFASAFTAGWTDEEAASSMREQLTALGKGSVGDEAAADRLLPQCIHLSDAHFFNTNGNPIPGNRSVLWRGRLSEVAGFSLGTLYKA